MELLAALGHALAAAGSMTWEITWALILGFFLSAMVQAVVRKEEITRLMPDDSPSSLLIAAGLGAASSSCSYAAVALARVLFRLFIRGRIVQAARQQADRGLAGSMEGHAAMDMSIQTEGSLRRRLRSRGAFTAVSHIFVMEWAAVIRDIVLGLLIAGAFMAWVPESFLRGFFFEGHPLASALWGPLVGPMLAVVSFVCSIGNIPLAAVLWNGGISFGGVVSFIFADLIIIPILLIYRKYFGTAMAVRLFGLFYLAMAAAGYATELIFRPLGLVPTERNTTITGIGVHWNYTTWLNIAFLLLAAALLVRFVRSGGLPMLRMMGGSPDSVHDHHGPEEETGHTHTASGQDERHNR